MATDVKSTASAAASSVDAPLLGATRLSLSDQQALLHADPAPLHEVPQDTSAEAVLAKVETLIGKGHLGAALQAASALTSSAAALAGRYELLRQEKVSRAQIGIADRYFLRGDVANARRFYQAALQPGTSDATVTEMAQLASAAFDTLVSQRATLIGTLTASVSKNDFTQWCGAKKTLTNLTLLDVDAVRAKVYPNFRLEDVYGERPPIDPNPGYVDPLPVETPLVAFPIPAPSAVFEAATEAAVNVDAPPAGVPDPAPGGVSASLAFPLFANVLRAKIALFALDNGLSVDGKANGTVPLFRYEHLRDQAKEIATQIRGIETRMLPIQLELDDFAEAVSAIKVPLEAAQAELAAVNQEIGELTQTLSQLGQIQKALTQAVTALDAAQDQCDCDWFCWLVSAVADAFVTGVVLAVVVSLAVATDGVAAALLLGYGIEAALAAGFGTFVLVNQSFTCENVGTIAKTMKSSLAGVQAAVTDNTAELQHALATRDVLIANINALTQELQAAYQSNVARVLNAQTLNAIQTHYNRLRQSLLTRAQAVAKLAEDAFNFERDAEVSLIQDAYYDQSLQGYTGAESLLHDLGGFDYMDLTGRTQKAIQISQMVSLRQHSPVSFLTLSATRTGRFTTAIADFDRWYPGTYQQRIKEVRVEVLVDGTAVPARGYLSNDGTSLVRVADPNDARPVDNVYVFAEPDPDIARLCYKRLQRRRHVDTMAFPAFESSLYDRRMGRVQDRERNFFENIGLESSWVIELLPDQPFDLSRVTDIRVWFQYEALFDGNLQRIIESKRYVGRVEMAAVPVGQTIRAAGGNVDFSATLSFATSRAMFDAPMIEKTMVDAGFAVRLKGGRPSGGAVTLQAAYAEASPVTLVTDATGLVATAADHPTGTGLAQLAAMVQGKTVHAAWTVKVEALPPGTSPSDIDELFLLLHCQYVT
jgi:hypothetical protein